MKTTTTAYKVIIMIDSYKVFLLSAFKNSFKKELDSVYFDGTEPNTPKNNAIL